MLADQVEQHRTHLSERQTQIEAVRHRNGELEGIVVKLRGQRDLMVREIESLRERLEALSAEKTSPKRRVKHEPTPATTVKAAK